MHPTKGEDPGYVLSQEKKKKWSVIVAFPPCEVLSCNPSPLHPLGTAAKPLYTLGK